MEYPFGHHHHHRHRRDDDGEEEFPPPGRRPPSSYDEPPPPQVGHVYHTSHVGGPPMEPNYGRTNYPPPPMDDNYGRTNYPQPPMDNNYGRTNYPQPPMDNNYGRTNYPPPPMEENYGGSYNRPPPPMEENYGGSYNRPPPISDYYEGPPPPQPPTSGYSSVQHVSHETESVDHRHHDHHRFQPHVPSFFHRQTSHPEPINKPSFRVYTKADPNYSLTIRDGKVVLVSNDPSDPFQHWYKDEKYSTKVKDEEGYPSFALVNKAAGLAMKHSIGASHPVQLIPYDPNILDASVLWTESRDVGDGYRAVRMVNNINLNLDAWNADKEHGGIRNGTIVALWEWWKGDNRNQHWKIVPY